MLSVEILPEVVSFLALYDLDPVLLANRQLSSIASKCANGIPVWHFEQDIMLFVNENSVFMTATGDAFISVTGRENIEDVLDIAFYNACFEHLWLTISADGVPSLPDKSSLKISGLTLLMEGAASADLLIDVIARFRKVQAVSLVRCENITDFSDVIDLCRQKGVRSVTNNGVAPMAEQ